MPPKLGDVDVADVIFALRQTSEHLARGASDESTIERIRPASPEDGMVSGAVAALPPIPTLGSGRRYGATIGRESCDRIPRP